MNKVSHMDKSDFNSVYYEYVELVYYVANNVVHDYHLAQDICQEVFGKLYFRIEHLDRSRIKGWILVTAENTAIDFLRQRNRYRECFEKDSSEMPAEHPDYGEFEKKIERKDFFRRVFAALHEKNREWYEIILGMDVAGCPAEQMARELGITENHLRVKRHRAKSWLRQKFNIEIQELL